MATFKLWEQTQKFLEERTGCKVYPPAVKIGECKEDYLILKDDASARYQNLSTEINYYDVLCYAKTYTGVLKLADFVRDVMCSYTPNMFPTGVETGAYYDDDVRAYMVSIQYRAMRRDKKVKMHL